MILNMQKLAIVLAKDHWEKFTWFAIKKIMKKKKLQQ